MNNTAVGRQVLRVNTTGTGLVGIGHETLKANTGDNNTGVGFQALLDNTSAANGTAVGYQSFSLDVMLLATQQ